MGTRHTFWEQGLKKTIREFRCRGVDRLLYFSAIYLAFTGTLFGQEVKVEISYDTVYAGNDLAVRYSIQNWEADMDAPDFGEFKVVGGPQISSSMSISGGQRSSSKTVNMILYPPKQPGQYILPSITFKGENKEIKTQEKTIVVVPNPESIHQVPNIESSPAKSFDRQYRRSEPPRGDRRRF